MKDIIKDITINIGHPTIEKWKGIPILIYKQTFNHYINIKISEGYMSALML